MVRRQSLNVVERRSVSVLGVEVVVMLPRHSLLPMIRRSSSNAVARRAERPVCSQVERLVRAFRTGFGRSEAQAEPSSPNGIKVCAWV